MTDSRAPLSAATRECATMPLNTGLGSITINLCIAQVLRAAAPAREFIEKMKRLSKWGTKTIEKQFLPKNVRSLPTGIHRPLNTCTNTKNLILMTPSLTFPTAAASSPQVYTRRRYLISMSLPGGEDSGNSEMRKD